VTAEGAPAAVGPYSHAVVAGGLVHLSGQVALDPASGELVGETAADQARQALANLAAVARAAGCALDRDAVRVTVWLVDMGDFADVNAVYAEAFGDDPPARVCVAVAALPLGARVEVDAILALPD
jgi:2-iminobutanoate/2-iminopropanoate deaminase